MPANSDSSSSLLPGTTPMPSAVTIPDSLFSYSPRSTVNHESSNVSPPQCLCHSSCNGQYQHTLRFPDISGSRSPTPSLPSTESSLSNNPSSINIGVSDNTTGLTTDKVFGQLQLQSWPHRINSQLIPCFDISPTAHHQLSKSPIQSQSGDHSG